MRVLPTLALIVIASLGAFGVFAPSPMAQFHGQHEAGYADLMNRTVKALSEAQTADLRAGRGMVRRLRSWSILQIPI